MNKVFLFLIITALVTWTACQSDGSGSTSTSNGLSGNTTTPTAKSERGVEFAHFSKSTDSRKPKIGDFLVMHMEHMTENDSVFYTSFRRNKPLTIRFSENLFTGILNDQLMKMSPGDSGVFKIPVKEVYKSQVPTFLKGAEFFKYKVKLLDIQDEETRKNAVQQQK